MDVNELWERTTAQLRESMTDITYNTMIRDNLTPVRLEGDRLILQVSMPLLRVAITNRYLPLIQECLERVAGTHIDAAVMTQAEIDQIGKDDGEQPRHHVQLNPAYTFDTFIVGSNNRFAHAAAVAVAGSPAEVYNPLFIYGGVGLGKTHLMHAIGHYILEQYPKKNLLYITSETFTNELIAAIQSGNNMEFRERYRKVDILMVDDIQFMAGRDSTQEEFFHTFNDLYNAGKQIILTSDRPPKDIARLEERLRSRFAWGLTCDIQKPDCDTRMAILKAKAKSEHISVPDSVLTIIAENIETNIRELEGSLKRVAAYASLNNEPITEENCRDALRDVLDQRRRRVITADIVRRTVCEYYRVDEGEVLGPSRRREVTVPRQVAMYLTREMTTMSLPQIGQAFGGRDHTTVLHSCAQVAASLEENEAMQRQVSDIRGLIREG